MWLALAAAHVLLAPAQRAGAVENQSVVATAARAVERGRSDSAAAAWTRRLAAAPNDYGAQLGLATLDRLTYRYPAAERRYRSLVARSGARPDVFAAQASIGLAYAFHARGLLDSARVWYERASASGASAPDSATWAEGLLGVAIVRARSANPALSLPLVDSAARLIDERDSRRLSLLHCNRSVLLVMLGREEGRREAMAGVALAREAHDASAEAGCWLTLATDFSRSNRTDSLAPVFARAESLLTRARNHSGLATVLQWHGYIVYSLGRPEIAQRYLGRAVSEAEVSGNLLAAAWATSNLAEIAFSLRDYASAAELVERAVALHTRTGDGSGVATAQRLEGQLAESAGDIVRARSAYESALRWAAQNRRDDVALLIHLAMVGLETRVGDWARAATHLDSARDMATRHGYRVSRTQAEFLAAVVAMRRGDRPATAIRQTFDAMLARYDSTQYRARYRVRVLNAELSLREGDLDRAEREMTAAADALDTWRAALSDSALRLLAFQSADVLGGPELGVATVIAGLAARGHTAAAFALAERRRARVLRDRLALLSPAMKEPSDARGPRIRRATLVSTSDVAAALPDERVAIVGYSVGAGAEPTALFVVTRTGVRGYALAPVDSLAPLAARVVAAAERGMDLPVPARALGGALLDAAVADLPREVRHLIILPDGVLYRVPFDALRLADGRAVVERFGVSYAPSAAVLLELWRRPRDAAETRILAFGDPRFDPARRDLPRLPGTATEARFVATLAPRSLLRLRDEASEAYLKRAALDSFRIVHVATHALVDDWSDARTVLALSPGEGEDGLLGPGDLAALRTRADLVVLSGCRTAGGVVLGSEGVRGLAIPLLGAGARSVLATRWEVGDRVAPRLVERFYRGLAAGQSAGEALSTAQRDLKRGGASVREWAAFSLTGDPLLTIPLHPAAAAAVRSRLGTP